MLNDPHTHGLWERTAPQAITLRALHEHIDANVVVIGAGFTGLSTALHLSECGRSVVVLEAVDVGFGGSGRSVGLVNAGMWIMPDTVIDTLGQTFGERLLQLLGDAPALVFDLIRKHRIECEATHAGTLHCGVGRHGLAQLEQRTRQWQSWGAPVRLLDASEAARRTGSSAFSGALWDGRAGTIQPLAYVRGLARAAATSGALLFGRSPALSAERTGSRWTIRTPSGSVRAEWLVVATDAYSVGPWQAVRAELVHLPYFNFATAPLDQHLLKAILPGREGAWDTRRVLCSFRLDAIGRLVFGSVGALRGAGARIHESWAKRALQKLFPQLGLVSFESSWYGKIGMTDDNLPRFHMCAPNVIGFSGYNGRGIAAGTVFGRVLSEFITGRITQGDLPLPVTTPRGASLRSVKELLYELGSQALHFANDRF